MEIKKIKDEGISISGIASSVLISKDAYKGDDYDIVQAKKFTGDAFSIEGPGEYEVSGVSILAQSSKMEKEIDITEIIVDDVSIIYVRDGFQYSKLLHDNLGQIDILVIEITEDKSISDLINKFDPEILIPVGEEEIVEKVLATSGVAKFTKEKKFKSKSEKLGNDNAILETVILL